MLKFIGNGSAFNTEYGNNCAYIKKDDLLILIDCGSNVFDRIRKSNLLDGINSIKIILTHTHPDHVGSLGDLIFYSFYSLGGFGIPKTTILSHPKLKIRELLTLMGVNDDKYNLVEFDEQVKIEKEDFQVIFKVVSVEHVNELDCFGYLINYNDQLAYYSGDSNEIPKNILEKLNNGLIDFFYQDTCKADYNGNVHLSLRKLDELVNREVRDRVYCMHLDEIFDIIEANVLGFNVVEPNL